MTIEIIISPAQAFSSQFIKVENCRASFETSHIFDMCFTITLHIEFLDVRVCVASSSGFYWVE